MKRKNQNLLKILSLGIIIFIVIVSCKNSSDKESKINDEISFNKKASIVYFHGKRRCPTCISVGNIAKSTYEELYKENKDVEFYEINIDEEKNMKIAEKYEVVGSALIIIGKDNFEDITGYAFKNATNNPDLLKEKIKELVNKYLNN